MKIRFGLIALAALLLSACGPQTYYMNRDSDLASLVVQGDATIKAEPDQMLLRLGVVSSATDADTALAQNNMLMQSLMVQLRELGISDREMATGQFQIRPEWSVPPRPTPANWQRRIVSYRVSNDLKLTTGQIDLAGELLSLAQKAGANQIGSLQFSLADSEEPRQLAIAAATRKARRKAQTLADAAGTQLGPLLSVVLDPLQNHAGATLLRSERAMAVDSVPVAPGQVDVKAAVTLTYQLLEAK